MSGFSTQITDLVRAKGGGPVPFALVRRYLREFCDPRIEDYLIAEALTDMIRSGDLDLADTGDGFIMGVSR